MTNAYICEGFRTPIGRFAGALAQVRADDLAAVPLAALRRQFDKADWEAVDEVIFGCANQAGEDNRNVARMAALLAGHSLRSAGGDREPALRFRHGGGGCGGARHRSRRDLAGRLREASKA